MQPHAFSQVFAKIASSGQPPAPTRSISLHICMRAYADKPMGQPGVPNRRTGAEKSCRAYREVRNSVSLLRPPHGNFAATASARPTMLRGIKIKSAMKNVVCSAASFFSCFSTSPLSRLSLGNIHVELRFLRCPTFHLYTFITLPMKFEPMITLVETFPIN